VTESDDAGACKVIYQAKRFVLQDEILYHLNLPRQRNKNAGELVSLAINGTAKFEKVTFAFLSRKFLSPSQRKYV